MIETMLTISLTLFGVAIAITFVRILLGPSFSDRVLSMDVIGVNLISAMAIVTILFETRAFFDVILILAILAFISTIAFSKFLERGVIIERKRDLCIYRCAAHIAWKYYKCYKCDWSYSFSRCLFACTCSYKNNYFSCSHYTCWGLYLLLVWRGFYKCSINFSYCFCLFNRSGIRTSHPPGIISRKC